MEQVSRRTFLKGSAGVGAGALLIGGTGTADAALRKLAPRKTTGQLSVAILGNAASNKVALQAFNKFQKETGIKTTPIFINVSTWVEFFQQILGVGGEALVDVDFGYSLPAEVCRESAAVVEYLEHVSRSHQ